MKKVIGRPGSYGEILFIQSPGVEIEMTELIINPEFSMIVENVLNFNGKNS